jgi:hypothetical protein
LKIKIISSPDTKILEREINRWLEENSWVKIVNLTQSATGTTTVVSIWYEEPQVPILG